MPDASMRALLVVMLEEGPERDGDWQATLGHLEQLIRTALAESVAKVHSVKVYTGAGDRFDRDLLFLADDVAIWTTPDA